MSGTENAAFGSVLLRSVLAALWTAGNDEAEQARQIAAAGAAMAAFRPADEIEAMLAAQIVAAHAATMECYRRAMLPEQPAELAARLRRDAANLSRTMTDMLAALDRHRGRGQQTVRVEHVTVEAGGQAIVGAVATDAAGTAWRRR